jgi:primosomal protein N' (replication factor Y)
MALFFDVVLNVPLNQTFTYREADICETDSSKKKNDVTAANLSSEELFGRRVEVRFGNRKMTGFITGVYDKLPDSCKVGIEKIRSVTRIIDDEQILTPDLFDLAKWISHYYISSIGEAVFSMIPSGKRETDSPGFPFSEDESSFEKRTLSDEQIAAVDGILSNKASDEQAGVRTSMFHYLYGMTGSGKTEVFLTAAERVLSQGKGVIYLVPEIGLTPQVVEAVVKRFGNTAAVLHSALTPSQRLGEWKRILHKEARVVVGARSAVFAPVPDLGMIIIDEEHDGSYKAGSSPRYHARQVAMYRSSKLHIPLVMGSATPSVEAYHLMETGALIKHTLTRRLAGGKMPQISCVNLSLPNAGDGCLSNELTEAIRKTLSEKRQVILFLNRRGFTHFFRCNSCGFELKCKNCSVSLTYHKNEKRLRCHYCGYSVEPPQQCPQCGSLDVGYSGFGTEFIEAEVKAKFPAARTIRIDTDSVTHKGELQEKIDSFRKGEYDILLGTQMVAKGLNFPGLQLVGVVLADTALHLPDFRAAERTFSLITQVAGRAGRFFPDGKVIVQSYSPDREPIACAVKGESDTFYKSELSQRKLLGFPPFVRLLRFVFRSQVPNAAQIAANGAFSILSNSAPEGVEILGPAECPLEMINNNYRMQILLRAKTIAPLQEMASKLIWGYTTPKNVYIETDVDPVNLL